MGQRIGGWEIQVMWLPYFERDDSPTEGYLASSVPYGRSTRATLATNDTMAPVWPAGPSFSRGKFEMSVKTLREVT